jgi:DNA-binding transcriptional regulator LsrR (DeoR family)
VPAARREPSTERMTPASQKNRTPLTQRDILRICYLFYKKEKTQEEIASMTGLSRFKILRILKEARESGLVSIHINDPLENLAETETKLAQTFHLKEAVVVRLKDYSDKSGIEQLGEAGADYLARVVEKSRVLGVAWGRTLFHVVDAFKQRHLRNLTVVQISGGLGSIKGSDTYVLTMTLSQRLGANARVIQAPVIVADRSVRDQMLHEKNIHETLQAAKRTDLAVLGIGVCSREGGLWDAGLLNGKDFLRLKKLGAVGAICGHFYNRWGKRCDTDLEDRIIGLTLEELKNIKRKIGIAMGSEKGEAILGALRGGWIDVLITDEKTAECVLAGSED